MFERVIYLNMNLEITGTVDCINLQVLGYGWAGLLRKYVVEPAHMWWPATLVQVSLFRYVLSFILNCLFVIGFLFLFFWPNKDTLFKSRKTFHMILFII